MVPQQVNLISSSVCIVKKDFFISGSCVLDHFGVDLSLSRDFPDVFKKRRSFSSSSKVRSPLNHLSLFISRLSESRDCCRVFSTCSWNSSFKLSLFKCFSMEKVSRNMFAFFQQNGICSLSTTGESPASTLSVKNSLTRFQKFLSEYL